MKVLNLRRAAGRIKRLMRLFFMSPSELGYYFKILRSPLFDVQYYRTSNPRMHAVSKFFARRHFVVFGEKMGLQPNPDFWPTAYLRYNPDIAGSEVSPFLHFITQGQYEGRIHKNLPEADLSGGTSYPVLRPSIVSAGAEYAVVAHLYYPELWNEFRDILQSLDIQFDLFVTITHRKTTPETLPAEIISDFPNAWVQVLPNQGRDILPFVALANTGYLNAYKAVCKIHTKKSPHRQDGDTWREHLISSILPGKGTKALVSKFLKDKGAAFLVADGQHFEDETWWGSNQARVRDLLARLDIRLDKYRLSFPAGSIYWLKPQMISMIRGLRLTTNDFEPELTQVDGTTAHALERGLGYLAQNGGQTTRQVTQLLELKLASKKAVQPSYTSAFYLPQFHPTVENDAWWGQGYTEWRAVTLAKARFHGHDHPHLPSDLGFYDLRLPQVMGQQAALAQNSGIDAFCVYHYWFDGQRVLEAPMDTLLKNPDIEFPFYLCWANESWRRNWDGLSGEVLLNQGYKQGFEDALVASSLPYMRDPRYQRPDGERPRFVIYRPEDMPDPEGAVKRMRAAWRKAGIGEVELGAVCFHISGETAVPEDLFDFWIEMPPHGLVTSEDYLFGGPDGNKLEFAPYPDFKGLIYDYHNVIKRSVSVKYANTLPKNTIRGVMPSWDNTARRNNAAHMAYGANPATFSMWLAKMCGAPLKKSYRQELMINAWNEWAEKAVLEPSQTHGRAYLDCVAQHLKKPAKG